MKTFRQRRTYLLFAVVLGGLAASASVASAQANDDPITRLDLPAGRSLPITTQDPITRVSVATPDIADAVVIDERNLVINGKANGETDIIVWITNEPRRHYRISVRSPSDRKAVILSVRVAEVRRDVLRELGVNGLYRDPGGHARAGTGLFNTDQAINATTGDVTAPGSSGFATLLTDFGTKNFLSFIDAQSILGHARTLAEPNLMAGNRDTATFLAGGEIPVPIAQAAGNGAAPTITIQFREFGIRLNFIPEIISDSMIKLHVNPEVSTIDNTNAVVLSGFRIPALRTRRISTTVDMKRDESVVLSGLMDDERSRTRTGIPFLSELPIIGALFGTSTWETNQTELLVVVTPTIINPMNPPGSSTLRILPDTALPAREAIEKRLPPPPIKP